jgi:hypothetical protein
LLCSIWRKAPWKVSLSSIIIYITIFVCFQGSTPSPNLNWFGSLDAVVESEVPGGDEYKNSFYVGGFVLGLDEKNGRHLVVELR